MNHARNGSPFLHIFTTMRQFDRLIIIIIDKHQFQQNMIFTSSQNVVFKICHVLNKIVTSIYIYIYIYIYLIVIVNDTTKLLFV